MNRIVCEMQSPSVVLLGNFNPSIFQPAWLARHELISEQAASSATIEIIRPEISIFTVVEEVRFVVELERCIIEAKTPQHEQTVLDLATGCFHLLEHTPVRAFGMNRAMHFRMPNEDVWNRLGHALAPKKSWAGLLEEPGMRSVLIEGRRPDNAAKFTVKVEPSSLIQPGVYVRTNEHHELEGSTDATAFVDALAKQWTPCQTFALKLAKSLLDRSLKEEE